MATSQASQVLQHLRRVLLQDEAGLTDGQLLRCFTEQRDGAAFAALVRRHGPLVWGVCRRLLGHHDAEEAFQATFLILCRRAGSIRRRDRVASWLFGVARLTALQARRAAARRKAREKQVVQMPEPAGAEQDLWNDVQPLLDQELSRLPDTYQAVILLCDLEGKTRQEVARQLGCPEGTVASRLARARALLAKRLARHGLGVSAAALATAVSRKAASACVPASVMSATIRAMTPVAAGRAAATGAASGTVAALAEGVLKAMFLNRLLKGTAAVLVAVAVAGAGGVLYRTQAAQPGRRGDQPAAPPTAAEQNARPEKGPAPAAPPARPADREAWARKLAALSEANWRTAFAVGEELAALPADEGFAILKANWKKIDKVDSRQQLLKAWDFARHPRLVDGLDLGMRDPSPAVQSWAALYLNNLALQEFAEDFPAYKEWYQANRDRPLAEVVARSARRFAAEAARSGNEDAAKRARWLDRHLGVLRDTPEARQAMLDAGFLHTLERWASGATAQSSRDEVERVANAVSIIGRLQPGEVELKRVVVPLLAKKNPVDVRAAAIRALEGRQNAWAIDLLLDALKESLEDDGQGLQTMAWAAADTLASMDDPRVIPTMIAVIDADNTYATVYGVGYFGLGRLTGVEYDESHNGAWWRRWWEKNKERYPEAVRALEIPRLPIKRQRPE
jgi:RNA polymerase sigma factor (sigma-70 family)